MYTKKIVVSDSSALILLAKTQLLESLVEYMDVFIPQAVFEEVSGAHLELQFPDAKAISELVKRKKIMVRKVTKHQKFPLTLGKGEENAIRLFQQIKADFILCDDGKALKVCRYLNIPFIISPYLVVGLFKQGRISYERAIAALEQLREIGRYAPDIIARAYLTLKEGKN